MRKAQRTPGRRIVTPAVVLIGLLALLIAPTWATASPSDPCAAPTNPVVCENSKDGSPDAEWDVTAPDDEIAGFSTEISVNAGSSIAFKVKTSAPYTINIYRLGYYDGDGARRVVTGLPVTARSQPPCEGNGSTGLYDCGTWLVSATWAVPADAVSGVYLALLHRTDTGGENHIPFVVRNDASTSALFFQTSDTTWQAYNTYGGANFYPGGNGPKGRSYKLSYNRPTPTHGNNFLFAAEYPMLRFLERNGYDVSYTSGIESDRRGDLIRRHKTFLSVGHDEYWSGAQRSNVEAARDAGVNLAFFAGNDVYWKTRYEKSIDPSATPYRTIVCYKETWDEAKTDPTSAWTGTWRDPRWTPPSDGGVPENNLIGTAYMSNFTDLSLTVPAEEGKLRLWRNTTVVSHLAAGAEAVLAPHTIGYESNEDLDNGFRPAGLIRLSETTGPTPEYLRDFGSTVTPGTTTHHLTMYRAPSGARVFSAGTIQWSWGLDEYHDDSSAPADLQMQQATVNILADMGAQPLTRMSTLQPASASTDTTAPTSVISSPAANTVVAHGAQMTVSGTAADAGGGQVGGVEVSTDGGQRWHPAVGRGNWHYTFKATGSGSVNLMVRATDDSGNIESAKTRPITVNCPCSLFSGAVPTTIDAQDGDDLELGIRFVPTRDGYISGVKFYKAVANNGSHTGTLWSASGDALATGTFSGESSYGWQTLEFANPVPVAADTAYVASYRARNGHYSGDSDVLYQDVKADPLVAPRAVPGAPNGVYGNGGSFPQNLFKAANYYVDVIYNVSAEDVLPPSVSSTAPAAGSTGVVTTAVLSTVFSEKVNESSIQFSLKDSSNATVAGTRSYDANTRTFRFTPSAPLSQMTTFTASVRAADLTGNMMAAPRTMTFTTRGADNCPCSLFSSASPSRVDSGDTDPTEVGVRFTASGNGYVTGVRFYKSVGNTGSHVGKLWSATGTPLATGTFANESASGWQTLEFADPVAVTAGTEYVASYYAPQGHYSADANYFLSDVVNEPLTAPGGANGTYRVGAGGGFPDSSFRSTNYWVDALFQTSAPVDNRAPVVVAKTPAEGVTNVSPSATVSAGFSEPVDQASIQFTVTGPGSSNVSGVTTYDAATRSAKFTPSAALTEGATYTAAVKARDTIGNVMAEPTTWSFTIRGACPCSLFPSAVPAQVDSGDGDAIEVGVRLTPSRNGFISGVRFYKSAANTGTHTGTLWSASGTVLATGTFGDSETQTGWQTLEFATPVAVTAGTTYVASYYAPNGHYSADQNYFTNAVGGDPLTAPASNNGVYAYGTGGGFPSSTFRSTNYWVDAVFETTLPIDTTAPKVTSVTPAAGATGVTPGVAPAAVFSEPVTAASVVMAVRNPAGVEAAGTVEYNSANRTARFTPTGQLAENTAYTVTARATDLAGNAMPAAKSWSFTTWSSAACPCTLLPAGPPAVADAGDGSPTELGVRFVPSVQGFITGVRFYKSAANTGAHTGTLWSTTGTALATGTFSSETATGWQTLNFASPVPVTAGTTYVASYFAPNGHYSADQNYFTDDVVRVPLTAPGGDNGVYSDAPAGGYPSSSFRSSNYWVDPVFRTTVP